MLTDEDLDQEDLDDDVTELLPLSDDDESKPSPAEGLFAGEIDYVQDFLSELRTMGSDSKFEQLSRDLGEVLKRRDSVIVFTQYTDTMDYLRGKLRQVYGGQVACYSGRGGELWDGSKWVGTSKENIKTAFRESREIKILLCTESASEGLNLQTCGVLINYEMPWNPMRVEQRIGRIDRIGQQYDRVWIRNYFYDGTVEATVYQRLDDRIASFESVVGELQPILSQVAKVIEAAAMANDKQRGELIAKEIAAINQQVQSAQVNSLNLDLFATGESEAAEELPAPITLQELEKAIVGSDSLRDRFRPHPTLSGAHQLDWHGAWHEVTFDPAQFDDHPNTLQLLSFGNRLLAEVLGVMDQPLTTQSASTVGRCRLLSASQTTSYYSLEKNDSIPTFARLTDVLKKQCLANAEDGHSEQIKADFVAATKSQAEHEAKAADDRHKARLSSLREEVRQLLTEAAYAELAMAANRDLFDEPLPLDFSEAAYQRLKRHKVPFSGALKLAGANLPKPRSDDPVYLRLRETKRDALKRRFDVIRDKLIERLGELVDAQTKLATGPSVSESASAVEFERYACRGS